MQSNAFVFLSPFPTQGGKRKSLILTRTLVDGKNNRNETNTVKKLERAL